MAEFVTTQPYGEQLDVASVPTVINLDGSGNPTEIIYTHPNLKVYKQTVSVTSSSISFSSIILQP